MLVELDMVQSRLPTAGICWLHSRRTARAHRRIRARVRGARTFGLDALVKHRPIYGFGKLEIYFAGPGEYTIEKALLAGADAFDCEREPCGAWRAKQKNEVPSLFFAWSLPAPSTNQIDRKSPRLPSS